MAGKQTQRGDTGRAYSLGFELVCAVAGFLLVGIWIDRHYRSGPWGTLICLGLGLIGGFYNLYRGAARLFEQRGIGAAHTAWGESGSRREGRHAPLIPESSRPESPTEPGEPGRQDQEEARAIDRPDDQRR